MNDCYQARCGPILSVPALTKPLVLDICHIHFEGLSRTVNKTDTSAKLQHTADIRTYVDTDSASSLAWFYHVSRE